MNDSPSWKRQLLFAMRLHSAVSWVVMAVLCLAVGQGSMAETLVVLALGPLIVAVFLLLVVLSLNGLFDVWGGIDPTISVAAIVTYPLLLIAAFGVGSGCGRRKPALLRGRVVAGLLALMFVGIAVVVDHRGPRIEGNLTPAEVQELLHLANDELAVGFRVESVSATKQGAKILASKGFIECKEYTSLTYTRTETTWKLAHKASWI